MEILLIRHGQSQADLEDRLEGRADFPLTELGRKQAYLAGQWLKERYPPELVLTSPLQRAAVTGKIIANASKCPVKRDPALMEWDNGLLAGLLRTEADQRFPKPQGGRKPHHRCAETESMIDFRARAETFWSRFEAECIEPKCYGRIAIVSHGGMINMLLRAILQLPMSDSIFFASADTGIHLLKVTAERKTIIFLNRQEHLQIRLEQADN
ncbi:MAG TPA: histidine phosphatase family protein [Firmicutes bacterium]|nr:histidine phosphatase family protein [Bacillota bacterium]